MHQIINSPIRNTTLTFLFIAIILAVAGTYFQELVFHKELATYNLLRKNYLFLGFTSVFMIVCTHLMFHLKPAQLPMVFLGTTVFKLGLFIPMLLQEETDMTPAVRWAIFLPLVAFMILEKLYSKKIFRQNK